MQSHLSIKPDYDLVWFVLQSIPDKITGTGVLKNGPCLKKTHFLTTKLLMMEKRKVCADVPDDRFPAIATPGNILSMRSMLVFNLF